MLQSEKKKKTPARRYRRVAICLIALLLLICGSMLVIPKLLARPLLLIFMASDPAMEPSGSGEDWFLFTARVDGSDYHLLPGTYGAFEYTWSPDGRRIAFGGVRQTMYTDIYVMDADGSHRVHLTGTIGQETFYRAPSWSPDGSQIAFAGDNSASHQSELWIVNSDGSSPVRVHIQPNSLLYPAWSPDGADVVFEDADGNIVLMDVHSLELVQLTNTGPNRAYPRWSPDGGRILFEQWDEASNKEIFVMNRDGTSVINLSNHPAPDAHPTWSPDGRKVLFSSGRDGNYAVYVVDADGTHLSRLTMTEANAGFPVWSPDGSKIAYQWFDMSGSKTQLVVMDADGTHSVTLGPGSHPFWRPNPCGAWDIVCYLTRP